MNQAFLPSTNGTLRYGEGSLRELAQLELLNQAQHVYIIASPLPLLEELGYMKRLTDSLRRHSLTYTILDSTAEDLPSDGTPLIAYGDYRSHQIANDILSNTCLPLISIPIYIHEEPANSKPEGELRDGHPAEPEFILDLPHQGVAPAACLIDPELSLHLTPKATALQGLSALIHATEAYLSTQNNPLCEMHTLKSVKLLSKYLPRAIKNREHMKNRSKIALACLLAQIAVSSSSRLSLHALSHLLELAYPHASSDSITVALAPSYFAHLTDVTPKRLMKLSHAITGRTAKNPEDFFYSLKQLQSRCFVEKDTNLASIGITLHPEQCERYALMAQQHLSTMFQNDSRLLTTEDLRHILEGS